jgi:hypothetical protein
MMPLRVEGGSSDMNHHIRSVIAIVLVLAFVGISWLLDHRPANWEYVFLMFVVFSSAMQDAMDDVKLRIGKATLLLETAARKSEDLSFVVRQEAEYLKSHVAAEAGLLMYKIELMNARQRDEAAPEAPSYPEPKFVGEPPKLEPVDARKWREERVREVATVLREYSWWDMTVVTIPFRRLVAYIMNRPGFIRWISG